MLDEVEKEPNHHALDWNYMQFSVSELIHHQRYWYSAELAYDRLTGIVCNHVHWSGCQKAGHNSHCVLHAVDLLAMLLVGFSLLTFASRSDRDFLVGKGQLLHAS